MPSLFHFSIMSSEFIHVFENETISFFFYGWIFLQCLRACVLHFWYSFIIWAVSVSYPLCIVLQWTLWRVDGFSSDTDLFHLSFWNADFTGYRILAWRVVCFFPSALNLLFFCLFHLHCFQEEICFVLIFVIFLFLSVHNLPFFFFPAALKIFSL